MTSRRIPRWLSTLSLLLSLPVLALAQAIGINPITGLPDLLSDVRWTIAGTGLLANRPATCSNGQVYVCRGGDCASGANIYICDTGVWVNQGGLTGIAVDGQGNVTLTGTLTLGAGTGLAAYMQIYGADGATNTTFGVDSSGSHLVAGAPIDLNTISPTALGAGGVTDWAPTGGAAASTWLITSDATGRAINSIAGGWSGRRLRLINNNSSPYSVSLVNATGATGDQFDFPTGNQSLQAHTSIDLEYVGAAGVGVWRRANSSNTLNVPLGANGTTTNTAHGVMLGQGTANVSTVGPCATTQVLRGITSADPVCGYHILLSGAGGGFTCASNTNCFTALNGKAQAAFPTSSGPASAILIPVACTLSNFYLITLNTMPGSAITTFSLEVNSAVATGISVATSGGTDVATLYSDTTHTYALSAGDRVYLKIAQATGNTSAQIGGFAVLCQ